MLATKVLASGITHLTDARYFAAWEVDYLAFPLGGENGISWEYLNALREWVEGPTIVAELPEGADGAAWAEELRAQQISLALLPYAAPATAPLLAKGIGLIASIGVEGYHGVEDIADALSEATAEAQFILLNFEQGGITWDDLATGHPFGLAGLDQLLATRPCLLQIDLGGANPKALKEAHHLAGFAVRGSSEEKVGYKSFDDLDDLFEGLEVFE
ncbi:MAG: hypothetical protein AAGF89_03090 [Bacteroidota bacterium]